MKTLVLATSILAANALAVEPELVPVHITTHCGDTHTIMQFQHEEFNEVPTMLGEAIVKDRDRSTINGHMIFWQNEDDSFTVTFTPNVDTTVTCYLVMGSLITEEPENITDEEPAADPKTEYDI